MMTILTGFKWLLNPRLIALTATLLALAGSAWLVHRAGHRAGSQEVQMRWTQEQLLTAQATAKLLVEARQKEQALQTRIDQLNVRHRNEKARIAAEYERTLDSLRDRPDARAPSGLPEGATPGVGCTGAGLAGPDATFLARYAADAAQLKAAVEHCMARYEAVRIAVEPAGK